MARKAAGAVARSDAEAQLGDDVFFSTFIPANVVFFFDSSGYMLHQMWHPDYDDNADYSATIVAAYNAGLATYGVLGGISAATDVTEVINDTFGANRSGVRPVDARESRGARRILCRQ